MPGIRTSIPKLAVAVFTLAAGFGATREYFPLEPGNSWVYRAEGRLGQQAASIEVLRSEFVGDIQYFLTRVLGRPVLLRVNEEGSLVSYDRGTRTEKLWVALQAAERTTFESSLDDCTKSGRMESRTEPMKTDLFESREALKIVYQPRCADAGIASTVFVPDVGLAEYTQTTIAGPVTYRLIYARTGVTVRSARELAFGISTDGFTYTPNSVLAVRLTLRNTSSEPVQLTFPSGQDYDIQIRSETGDIVYTWSADQVFAAVFRSVEFGPGERNWLVEIMLDKLRPGTYFVEGWLATTPRSYAATTSVGIRAGN